MRAMTHAFVWHDSRIGACVFWTCLRIHMCATCLIDIMYDMCLSCANVMSRISTSPLATPLSVHTRNYGWVMSHNACAVSHISTSPLATALWVHTRNYGWVMSHNECSMSYISTSPLATAVSAHTRSTCGITVKGQCHTCDTCLLRGNVTHGCLSPLATAVSAHTRTTGWVMSRKAWVMLHIRLRHEWVM